MKKTDLKVSINLNKPENLNLEDLINPNLPHFIQIRKDDGGSNFKIANGRYLIKQIPALYYFIHILIERQYSKNNIKRCKYNNKLVKMYSRDIEPFKSKNDFKLIWTILYQLKIIVYFDDNEPTQYRKSAKAYYFGFSQDYLDSKVVQHEILVRKDIADSLNSKSNNSSSKSGDKLELLSKGFQKQLFHQYKLVKNIVFDEQEARLCVEKLLDKKAIEVGRYNTCIVSINNIVNSRVTFNKSGKCDRLYTNVTGMPKELRPYIKDIEGNSLVELDFASFNAFVVYKIINSFTPDFKSNVEKIAFENEVDLYRRLLSGGDFYNDFKGYFFKDEELSRDEVKDIVLKRWFNGKLNSQNKYRKHLLIRMPIISSIIDSMKAIRYKDFSIFTMKMESELVNDIIYKKYIDLHPDALMYTIFDSIMVEQRYAVQLQSLMVEEGSRYFNLNCIVKNK